MNLFRQTKSKKYLIAGALALAIAVLAGIAGYTVNSYAAEEYWDVKIGDKTVAVLTSESSAKQVIRDVKHNYVEDGAVVKSIQCTPEMTVEKKTYQGSDRPAVSDAKEAAAYILSGTKEKKTYTVKTGDSPWTIAEKHGFSLEELYEMNGERDFSTLFPGDQIRLYQMKPMVDVTVTQEITSEKEIKFKTETRTSSEALKNTTVVKQKGVPGRKQVTEIVTSKNGTVTDTQVLSSKVLQKPKKEIVLKGTGILPAPPAGKTYQGNGSAIAQYALQFVGNPYVYGGESLTNGADCSGFVLAVYRHFGITMAHDAGVQRTYGKEVSMASAQPGDLVCFYGHIGIYIGGGQIVHAVNEGMGIAVTGATYTGPVISVRRIVE